LKGTIELADGLLFIDTLVALEALNEGFTGCRDRLSERRFPAPRRPFDDNRLLHPGGEIDDLERDRIDYVPCRIQATSQLVER